MTSSSRSSNKPLRLMTTTAKGLHHWASQLRTLPILFEVFGTVPTTYVDTHSLYCTVVHCTSLYCTVVHCTSLYCTSVYCHSLYCTSVYCTSLYCTSVYCHSLYCTSVYCHSLYCTGVLHEPPVNDQSKCKSFSLTASDGILRFVSMTTLYCLPFSLLFKLRLLLTPINCCRL